jgi:phosphoenolpyruvate carboxylase
MLGGFICSQMVGGVPMVRSLSEDVHWVGNTLGHVLKDHGGIELFEHVETMRTAAKTARDTSQNEHTREQARLHLETRASSLTPSQAYEVARAFTLYFQVVNLAEDVHRTRELRRRELEAGRLSVAESTGSVIHHLRPLIPEQDKLIELLEDVTVRFVFTAHPTEARRRTTERLLTNVREILEIRDRTQRTPQEHQTDERRLRATMEALWEHASERSTKPEVLEEVKTGLWYLRHVLLDVVPRFQRMFAEEMSTSEEKVDPMSVPNMIEFGSWMGSDRDGNPFVTDAVTERTMELQHWIVLQRYTEDLQQLIDPLAAVRQRLVVNEALDEALLRAEAAVPELIAESRLRNQEEPLRRLLTFMAARIERTRNFSAGSYPHPEAFLEDLSVLRETLLNSKAAALANDALLDLMLRVRAFGFSLAKLDVREDSRVHESVVAELLRRPDYATCTTPERIELLSQLCLPARGTKLSPESRRLLELFATIQRLQARFGAESVGTYVISMTENACDVMEILTLAKLHSIDQHLDIVPLLETPEDLARCEALLSALFVHPGYRDHLRQRHDVQELLVGYSDSMKQGGILASRVRIVEAQRTASEVCKRFGITLRVFHGRGGSLSRGGGPTHRAIRALPPSSFSGTMKITEQGEMRSHNFANPDLALRYLEQAAGASILLRKQSKEGIDTPDSEQLSILRTLAETSQSCYQALIHDPDLITYFLQATPFEHIASLNIASRPAKRRKGRPGLADMRAIPWVFSWSQSRHVVTGWYGVGTALEQYSTEHGIEKLQSLYENSAFFEDFLDNVHMSLAKADLAIAHRYAALCEDEAVSKKIFGTIRDEYDRTSRLVLQISGLETLLDEDPVLQKSIRLRNPYVDPLSYLQIAAMKALAHTTDEEQRAAWSKVARVAVQGIAAGLRHTG